MVLCSVDLTQSVALGLFLKRQSSSVYLVCFIKLFCIINFLSVLSLFIVSGLLGGSGTHVWYVFVCSLMCEHVCIGVCLGLGLILAVFFNLTSFFEVQPLG